MTHKTDYHNTCTAGLLRNMRKKIGRLQRRTAPVTNTELLKLLDIIFRELDFNLHWIVDSLKTYGIDVINGKDD